MPGTVNGIGTHYYGKKDVDVRDGVCEHCGKAVQLQTYETRLWFVILFIPIIPLGRKQILDYCPSCTWHRALPKAEWDRMKSEAIGGGMARMSKDPNDPKAAMELLGSLGAFRKREEGRQFAALMETRFPSNFEVQFFLGGYHEQAGDGAKADACFERALALEPDSHAARRAVGVGCIQRGDLARARELLSFMETPGPDQDVAVLRLLATAYEGAGRPDDALHLNQLALQSAPALGRNRSFRKAVRRLERSLGRRETMLPTNRRLIAAVGAGAAGVLLILGGLFAVNAYSRSHQTLHVLNGLPASMSVAIDGGAPVTVGGYEQRTMSLGEGKHEASVVWKDGREDAIPFEFQNGFWERMGSGSVFVLNPVGAGVIVREEITYVAKPATSPSPSVELRFGERFIVFRGVDYPFTDPPQTLSTESHASQIRKTHLQALLGHPIEVIAQFPNTTPTGTCIEFCELHLDLGDGGAVLLRAYESLLARDKLFERGAKFLERGLDRRPVDIDWHRAYQGLCDRTPGAEQLAARYDAMLKAEPQNSALLYLRGRIESGTKAVGYFYRAIAADAKNPYPWLARGYRLAGQGAYAEAKQALTEAVRLAPQDEGMAALLLHARFALGEYADLRTELAKMAGEAPTDLDIERLRLAVLIALGDVKGAEQVNRDFASAVQKQMPEDPYQLARASNATLFYLRGNLEGIIKLTDDATDADSAESRFQACVEQGRTDVAERTIAQHGLADSAENCLLLGLAFSRQGKSAQAKTWMERAVAAYARGERAERDAARLLRKPESVDLESALELSVSPVDKRTLVVALAQACPAKRTELLALAERLNWMPLPPHRFLKTVIEALRTH